MNQIKFEQIKHAAFIDELEKIAGNPLLNLAKKNKFIKKVFYPFNGNRRGVSDINFKMNNEKLRHNSELSFNNFNFDNAKKEKLRIAKEYLSNARGFRANNNLNMANEYIQLAKKSRKGWHQDLINAKESIRSESAKFKSNVNQLNSEMDNLRLADKRNTVYQAGLSAIGIGSVSYGVNKHLNRKNSKTI